MKNHETELIENEELCDLYRKKAEELVSQMTIEELADQTLNSAPPIERLNIKGYDWWNEGLHGGKSRYGDGFSAGNRACGSI